ncbi:Uncharacterised protein [Serratia ficaria]|uniref:hypothetical protein n=1 Tax=Serratia ficaria TaxID=61651 RepID=UPI00218289EF|nr:hypothetical protein [Serratia ficaria]CAI2496323.1 Uncharacterised protein [Serratia ficaria]
MLSRRSFMLTGVGILFSTYLSGAAGNQSKTSAVFKAGSGKAWVTFDAMNWPIDGFSGQHDALGVRVLLMTCGQKRYAIVVVELTSLSEEMISGMKKIVTEKTQITAENIMICASHTFSVPHVFPAGHIPPGTDQQQNGEMLSRFNAALLQAVIQAVDTLQPAQLGFGSGVCRVNINRDQPGEKGWWLGAEDSGFADSFLGVVRIDNLHGEPMAVLFNYAVQSSVTEGFQSSGGGKQISADLAGTAARYIEKHASPATVALFLVGAAGDQAPIFQAMRSGINDDGSVYKTGSGVQAFELLNLLTERLGSDVMRILNNITTSPPGTLDIIREELTVPALSFTPQNAPKGPVTTFHYQPAGEINVPVILMRMGNIIWIGLQPELSAATAAWIRENSPFHATLVSTMVDGAAKYMPDAQSYDRFTYEARSSPFARGAAELLSEFIIDRLRQLHQY